MSAMSFQNGPLSMRVEEAPEAAQQGEPRPPRGERATRRSRFLQGLKTFLWVAPLTVLLWVYAEKEMEKQGDVRVQVEVVPASGDRIVTLISPTNGELRLELKGPSASLDALRSEITDPRKGPLKIVINEPPPYEGNISVEDRLSRSDQFTNKAVVVKRAEPVLRVKVEAKSRRDVPLLVRPDQRTIASIIEPKTVSVEGPESQFYAPLVVYADVSELANKDPGERDADVPVGLYEMRAADQPMGPAISGLNVTLPARKRVKLEVPKLRVIEETITKSIPLYVHMPASKLDADKYRIDLPRVTLPAVKVSGPPEMVAKLTGPTADFNAAAFLTLTLDDFKSDLLGQKQSRALKPEDYQMPPGVKVLNPDTIEFTISDKAREPG